jgi:uncharacterized protein
MNVRLHNSISLATRIAILCTFLAAVPPTHAAPQALQNPSPTNSNQALAERGESGGQYRLAKSILAHNPSPVDIQTALKYLRASVAQQDPNAEFFLGYLYEHGKFVPQDYALAFQNYEAATRVHYSSAENNLASLYQHGQGVPKNIGKAFEWYLAAAQHGNPVGQINLANLYCGGDGVSRDYDKAVYWLRLSADSGLPEAQNNLAYFYFYGISVQRDYNEAARLVRLAAQHNIPGAQTSLAYLYEQGKGVPLDYVAAYTWYSRAIAAGDHTGERNLKHLARLMTPKQRDEANAQITTASTPQPAASQPSFVATSTTTPISNSLLSH